MSYEENDFYYDDFAQSHAPEAEYECGEGCGNYVFRDGDVCEACDESDQYDRLDPHSRGDINFADPGGTSALRAASSSNPRNLPCPTCGEPNRLTPADVACGYQCDSCADSLERGY